MAPKLKMKSKRREPQNERKSHVYCVQVNMYASRQQGNLADRQKFRYSGRHGGMQTSMHPHRQAARQLDRQVGKHAHI